MGREQVTTVPPAAGEGGTCCLRKGGRAAPSPLLWASARFRRQARKRVTGMARTTRHTRTCPPCPCSHDAARQHLQRCNRGVDGPGAGDDGPPAAGGGGHVACAPAAGRVSDPSTEVQTPARDKQRRVQPRCPRTDKLSPASGRPSGALTAALGISTVQTAGSQTRHRHGAPVRAQRGTPAPAPRARARTTRHASTCNGATVE